MPEEPDIDQLVSLQSKDKARNTCVCVQTRRMSERFGQDGCTSQDQNNNLCFPFPFPFPIGSHCACALAASSDSSSSDSSSSDSSSSDSPSHHFFCLMISLLRTSSSISLNNSMPSSLPDPIAVIVLASIRTSMPYSLSTGALDQYS